MSFVNVSPEALADSAARIGSIGTSVDQATSAAAARTTQVAAMGGDEVSTAIAALFSNHAATFQALTADASQFHQQFVQLLNQSAASYQQAEAQFERGLRTAATGYQDREFNIPTSMGSVTTHHEVKIHPPIFLLEYALNVVDSL